MQNHQILSQEKTLLDALRRHPKGADVAMLLTAIPTITESHLVERMNALSTKQLVDFITIGKSLAFRARDLAEVTKHVQLVNASIKSLEKRALIKSLKSVKNPTRKLYILAELEPSTDLTGGSWYTDQEFDLEFIEALSKQCYKFIFAKTFPVKNKKSIYPATHESYPTSLDVLNFIKKTGITTVDLSPYDVKQLLERLVYDGRVYKRMKRQYTHSFDEAEYNNNHMNDGINDDGGERGRGRGRGSRMKDLRALDSDDDVEVIGVIDNDNEEEGMRVVERFEEDDVYMYLACGSDRLYTKDKDFKDKDLKDGNVNGSGNDGREGVGEGFGDVPCGKCPVFSFCSSDGPVNPGNCEYMNKWLAF